MVSLRNATGTIVQQQSSTQLPQKQENTSRAEVKPVYALCGHIGRSEKHTCGAWTCLQMYGW